MFVLVSPRHFADYRGAVLFADRARNGLFSNASRVSSARRRGGRVVEGAPLLRGRRPIPPISDFPIANKAIRSVVIRPDSPTPQIFLGVHFCSRSVPRLSNERIW